MSLYARSCELSGLTHSGTALETTTAGRYSSTYGIRQAIFVNSGTSTEWLGTGAGLDGGPYTGTFYMRGFFLILSGGGLTSGRTLLAIVNNSGQDVFRLQAGSSNAVQPQYWNGSSFTNIGTTWTPSVNTLYKYDLTIVCGGSGSFILAVTNNMSIEPVSVTSGSASMTNVTNLDAIKTYSTNSTGSNGAYHSEWIWGDEPTTGMRYAWAAPSGNGTYVGSGSFSDVNEAVTNDATLSSIANNGDPETYTHSAMTIPAGTVKAVQIESRLRKVVASGAQNVKARIRIGSTNYDAGSNFSGISTSFGPYVFRWATNPAGGSWTTTTAGQTSNEFGDLAQT